MDAQDSPAGLLTAEQARRMLAVSRATIYDLAQREPETVGAVRLGRIVRFRRAAIERIVNGDAA